MTRHSRARGHRAAAVPALTRLGAMAAATLLAAGCGMLNDPVEERWKSRPAFPSCGAVELDQLDETEERAAKEIACLRRALERGESAELRIAGPTVEGDPVREYFRLTPQGRLEVYTDSTDDRFSDGSWSFAECYAPEWLPEVSCDR